MKFLSDTWSGMGLQGRKQTSDLNDSYSPGGTDSRSSNALNNTGMAYAQYLEQALKGNPYQQITGAQPTMNLNENGLTQGQNDGFSQAIRQAMSQLSGGGAQRGFLNPESAPMLAASAAKQVMPQFAPLMSQNLAEQFNQNMGNQQLQANLATTRMNQSLGLLPNYRTQDQTSTTRGPGSNYQALNSATDNWYQMWNNIGSSWGGRPGGKV